MITILRVPYTCIHTHSLPQGNTAWAVRWWRPFHRVAEEWWVPATLVMGSWRKLLLSNSTQSIEMGPPWLKGGRRLGKRKDYQRALIGLSSCWLAQQEVHPRSHGSTTPTDLPTRSTDTPNTPSANPPLCVRLPVPTPKCGGRWWVLSENSTRSVDKREIKT